MKPDSVAPHDNDSAHGIVFLVGAGPGDPDLLTLKGRACLERADVVVFDRLAHPLLLTLAAQAEWIDVGKRPDDHPIPQEEINRILIEHALAGGVVVRLKGGDPLVFGRGGEEAQALSKAGVAYEIVPGVTSAIAGPAYAGIPVTHRSIARSVAFITGHHNQDGEATQAWRQAASSADTLVFLMGVRNLPQIVAALIEGGLDPATPAAMVARATLPEQTAVRGSLETIVAQAVDLQPPALLVVGQVVALGEDLSWFGDGGRLLGLTVLLAGLGPGAFNIGAALVSAGAHVQPASLETPPDLGTPAIVVVITPEAVASDIPPRLTSAPSPPRVVALGAAAEATARAAGLEPETVVEPEKPDLLIERLAAWLEP